MDKAYKLLSHNDIIQEGDEFLQDDCMTWKKTNNIFVGHKYNPYFHMPCRRPTGFVAQTESGHLYELGTKHDCDEPNCPARRP
jgi:hypothetical protein